MKARFVASPVTAAATDACARAVASSVCADWTGSSPYLATKCSFASAERSSTQTSCERSTVENSIGRPQIRADWMRGGVARWFEGRPAVAASNSGEIPAYPEANRTRSRRSPGALALVRTASRGPRSAPARRTEQGSVLSAWERGFVRNEALDR